jgi:inorganic pyrophosphatase
MARKKGRSGKKTPRGTARNGRYLASPSGIPSRGSKREVWNVVIETPRGSPHKYKFEPDLGTFTLSMVLPQGMTFPYDFGFVPGTCAEDGDPLDVLLLMDRPAFCGCVVPARFIGAIQARQTEKGKTVENDRLVAIPETDGSDAEIRSLREMPATRLQQITDFFENYDRELGRRFELKGIHGPRRAERLARAARRG